MKISLPFQTPTIRNAIALLLAFTVSQQSFSQDYGKSFVDYNAGTIQPGDTLQIRATFVVRAGTFSNCSFTDAIPANTSFVSGSLCILTNEGKIYKSFTDASGDDAGSISGSSIIINMGNGATATSGGSISNTSKPSFYGSTCIMVASYKIVVKTSAVLGSTINIGGGNINYKSGTVSNTITFPSDNILLYQNYALCTNSVGGNALSTEYSGTFGSGTTKDRAASSNVPSNYTYTPFSSTTGLPGDYYYGVSNNTSGGATPALGYSIVNTWTKPDKSQTPTHRIFGLWDIIGDHTGAVNPALGNPATDVNSGAKGGYMLVINASYRTDTAFLDTVTNLCPNTYYQYTAWIRNMCSKCGCDSNGLGATSASAGYIATGVGDSSGVHPNMTFNVNGTDYYTTGDIAYTGQWVQKGFVYLTGPSQTTMIISVHNNAPGGGGNDWALDDISVSTCLPTIALLPNKGDTLCMGSDDTVRYQVTSNFNNYTQWEMQKSFDNGVTWVDAGNDTTGASSVGTGTPVYNAALGKYQYTVTLYYRLDNTYTLVQYRLQVASIASNLGSTSCSVISSDLMIVRAINCMNTLPVNFIWFRGQIVNSKASLTWETADETPGTNYLVERSYDQVHFEVAGTVTGNATTSQTSSYSFTDPAVINSVVYYRIILQSGRLEKISETILLSTTSVDFGVKSLVNPFSSQISFQLIAPKADNATVTLFDIFGKPLKQQTMAVNQGLNSMVVPGLGNLPPAVYVLKIQFEDKIVVKEVLKN